MYKHSSDRPVGAFHAYSPAPRPALRQRFGQMDFKAAVVTGVQMRPKGRPDKVFQATSDQLRSEAVDLADLPALAYNDLA